MGAECGKDSAGDAARKGFRAERSCLRMPTQSRGHGTRRTCPTCWRRIAVVMNAECGKDSAGDAARKGFRAERGSGPQIMGLTQMEDKWGRRPRRPFLSPGATGCRPARARCSNRPAEIAKASALCSGGFYHPRERAASPFTAPFDRPGCPPDQTEGNRGDKPLGSSRRQDRGGKPLGSSRCQDRGGKPLGSSRPGGAASAA